MDASLLPSGKILSTTTTTTTTTTTQLNCSGSTDNKKSSKSEETVFIPSMATKKTSEPVIFTGAKCTSLVEVGQAECTSAVTGSVSSSEKDFHVVKIKISPDKAEGPKCGDREGPTGDVLIHEPAQYESEVVVRKPKVTIVSLKPSLVGDQVLSVDSKLLEPVQILRGVIPETVDIKSNSITSELDINKPGEMVQKPSGDLDVNNPTYLYYMMTSGQCSPSDTLDSGTCSDLESGNNNTSISATPPPLPKKMGSKLKLQIQNSKIVLRDQEPPSLENKSETQYNRISNLTDSDESESSLSCDSLNSSELAKNSGCNSITVSTTSLATSTSRNVSFFPDSLLRDIRDRKFIASQDFILRESPQNGFKANYGLESPKLVLSENKIKEKKNKSCVLITQDDSEKTARIYENDKYYKFHINEKDIDDLVGEEPKIINDESFAGYKDIKSGTSTIRSSKGTVRGVKNRVRNGIATFLQMQHSNLKNYKEKDSGKVVLYTTSMGIVRETYAKCANVKQILRTLLIKFEERDVFMSSDYQQEIKERMQSDEINVPQLFVEGQHIGDAETVERLNESGELRKMLKPYKSMNASLTCQVCGGYRLLPCPSCNGSKKSVHRNHFTAEFVALKCMNCDEVGLVKCHNC